MALLSSTVTVALQVALTTNPGDVPTWTTVASNTTKKLRSWKIDRGRSSVFDQFPAGKASFVLDNRDRSFDPLYSAGTYYGQLLPMKRIRLQVTYASITYTRFDGFVDGWPQTYLANGKDAVVQLQATDASKWLARKKVASVSDIDVRAAAPTARWRLGEQSGTVAVDSSGNGYDGTYTDGATFNSREGAITGDPDPAITFADIVRSDGLHEGQHAIFPAAASIDGTGDFSIEFWMYGLPAALTVPLHQGPAGDGGAPAGAVWRFFRSSDVTSLDGTFTYSTTTRTLQFGLFDTAHTLTASYAYALGPYTGSTTPTDSLAARWNHFVGVRSGTTATLYINGAAAASTTGSLIDIDGSQPIVASPGTGGNSLDEIAVYNTALTPTQIAELYAAGTTPWDGDGPGARAASVLDAIAWPAADRNLSTGSASLGPATLQTEALSHLQAVADSEGGRLFVSRDGKVTLLGRSDFWTTAVYNTSQATFGDAGAELPYSDIQTDYSDQRVRNDVRINPKNGSVVAIGDATSQGVYGPITLTLDTLESRRGYVLNQAQWILAKTKDAAFEVTGLTLDALRSPAALLPVLLGGDIGYRYTVKRRPQAIGSAISQDVQLEGITESGTPEAYTFTLSFSPAEPAVFLLDAGILDTSRLAY